jgi:hypothetical protein
LTLLLSSTLVKGTDEWRLARIREIAADFYLYAEKNLKVRDKDGSIVQFIPNSVQKKLVELVLLELAAGRPVRFIILKARQMGISTIIEAIIFWYTATHKNISATIVAHLDDASRNIYEMFRRYYDNALPTFQPKLRYNTKKDLTFEVLGSTIMTGSAESKEIGRSRTNQILHNSEVAFWANGQELVAGLMQTVPMRANTMVFHESTANGIGGYFYETWQSAKRGDSTFTPVFFAWFDTDEYRVNLPVQGISLSDSEKAMKLTYKLEDTQLMWYRMKLREFGNDTDRMKQEYPSNDMEAFIASGRPRFDINKLLDYEQQASVGDMIELVNGEEFTYTKVEKASLQVWKYPDRLGQYVMGVDVAEGLEHGDYSVITVLNKKTMEVVARWRGHCDPDRLGDIAYDIGMWYMRALLGTEVNNHGLTTLQRLKDRNYPTLYTRDKSYEKEYYDTPASQLGWRTDLRTKPLMIDYYAQAIREGSIKEYDITAIRECMTYVVDENGRTNAQEGCFDDCVISTAIALQMFQWSFSAPDSQDFYYDPNYTPTN